MPSNGHLQRVTLMLAGVSAAVVQVGLHDLDRGAGMPLLGVSLVLAAALWLWARTRRVEVWTPATVAAVLVVALLPLGMGHGGTRSVWHRRPPTKCSSRMCCAT